MKTKIVANTVVLQSAVPFDVFKKLERFQPAALTKVDEDKHPILTATVAGKGGCGSIASNRIVFNPEDDAAGKAVLTITLPFNEIEDKKAYIAENFGATIMVMNEFENEIIDAAAAIDSRIDAVKRSIEEA